MDTPLDIGSALVTARRIKGLSQRELGDLLGVRQQQIARWEASSYRTADLQRVDAAARELGLTLILAAGASLANDPAATYATGGASLGRVATSFATATDLITPVRDLGEIAARIRAHGDELRDRFKIDRIGVFGSFVYGAQTASSDVDLLVETADPGGLRFIEAAEFAEHVLGRRVDFIRPHLLRERLSARVLKEAVYVWEA